MNFPERTDCNVAAVADADSSAVGNVDGVVDCWDNSVGSCIVGEGPPDCIDSPVHRDNFGSVQCTAVVLVDHDVGNDAHWTHSRTADCDTTP